MSHAIYHDNHDFFTCPLPCNNYLIYQAGEMYCKKDTQLHTHHQRCYEISFAVDGHGCSGAYHPEAFGENDCFFSLFDEPHVMETDTEQPLRFHFLGFSPQPNTAGERYIAAIEKCIGEKAERMLHLPAIHPYLDDILSEIKQGSLLSLDVIDCLLTRILIEIIRAYSSVEMSPISHTITTDSMLVYRIIAFLDENACSMGSLKELEGHFNYSYPYLSALFHRIMPLSLHEYFQKVKMEEAKRLLCAEGKNVTQVSKLLQYASVHTFSRSYKNYFGYPPSQDFQNSP